MALENRMEENRVNSWIVDFLNKNFVAIMLGPALFSIFIIFIYPVLNLIWQSLHTVSLATGGYEHNFVGLDNFTTIISSPEIRDYFINTLMYSFGSLIISVSAGLSLALAVNHVGSSRLRTVYSTLLLSAWASPLVVSAMIWRWILNGDLGILNMIITDLGGPRISWLVDPTLAMISVIFVDAWIRTPFAMLIFLAGLQAIPQHMYDATKVDGATTFQAFRNVTLPYLLPSFAIVILINWMFSFRAFSVVWTLTNGGPSRATEVLATHIYREGIVGFNLGYAAAVAVLLVIVTLCVAAFVVTKVMVDVEE